MISSYANPKNVQITTSYNIARLPTTANVNTGNEGGKWTLSTPGNSQSTFK